MTIRSIAMVGPDGAGKTTLARMLAESRPERFKYLYMGIDVSSSNVALPTSRLIDRWRHRFTFLRTARHILRLLNRLAEEWARQFVSWYYQLRGFTVLYDRHFVFDFAPEMRTAAKERFDRRLHRWCVLHLYPRPDLVIFLDAPGELLFARKGESSVAELERRRGVFLRVGARFRRFVRIDATRALPEVFADVSAQVTDISARERPRLRTAELLR